MEALEPSKQEHQSLGVSDSCVLLICLVGQSFVLQKNNNGTILGGIVWGACGLIFY